MLGASSGDAQRRGDEILKKHDAKNVSSLRGEVAVSRASLITALVLAVTAQVFGLGADHPADRPVNLDKAPPGLNKLINNTNRIHGFFVNAEDRFFFSGDTALFASFLKQYAALKGVAGHRLVIHTGKGVAKSPWDDGKGKPCEWMLDVAPVSWRKGHADKIFRDPGRPPAKKGEAEYLAEVHVWLKGSIDMKKLTIPGGIHVEREAVRAEDGQASGKRAQAKE